MPDPVAPALDSFPELLPVFLAAVRVNLLTATLEQGRIPSAECLDLLPVIREDMFGLRRVWDDGLIESD